MFRRRHPCTFIWGGLPARPHRLLDFKKFYACTTWNYMYMMQFNFPRFCFFLLHIHKNKSNSIRCMFLSGWHLQNRISDAQATETGGRPKLQKPWIPPGRLACRRDVGPLKSQVSLYIKSLKKVYVQLRRQTDRQTDALAELFPNSAQHTVFCSPKQSTLLACPLILCSAILLEEQSRASVRR